MIKHGRKYIGKIPFSEESRKKMSISQTGKKLSEETRNKMSESSKKRWAKIKESICQM